MQNSNADLKLYETGVRGKLIDLSNNVSKRYLIVKRIIDVIGSSIGIILLLPVFIIVAVLIKLEDPKGKVFFGQERCGQYNQTFKMLKFRSMVYNAEELLKELQHLNEQTGPVFKIKDDPRITRVGKFIRKTSIDELPQLINIFKGEMSLVGPRPPIPREVEQYNSRQMQRLAVKPGLTCYWQVGGRNSIDFDGWVELDLKYIQERSTLVDIKLILKTFFVLFGDDNAS
ncbi:sugar transferase [Paraclostridium sordellii]|uniref:sugar transferase n=1 Tax=Paraclostridium sordellii TaxID=1505 RepID=UPI001F062677|nr:sugar transferase [Paeniclostridium sordellii]MCH1967210.1 sugar transferase [Paeniclostridium sordellii]